MAQTKTYNMTVRPGVYKVASETQFDKEYDVTAPTCTCPHYSISHRGVEACKHCVEVMIYLLDKHGYDVTPR